MAKAKVEFKCESCGKAFARIKNCRDRKEADSWETWMMENFKPICPECAFEAYKAEEARKAKEANEQMPDLTGSEKQIAWAMTIRAKFIEILRKRAEGYDFTIVKLFPTDSRWWIDHRNDVEKASYGVVTEDIKNQLKAAIAASI